MVIRTYTLKKEPSDLREAKPRRVEYFFLDAKSWKKKLKEKCAHGIYIDDPMIDRLIESQKGTF